MYNYLLCCPAQAHPGGARSILVAVRPVCALSCTPRAGYPAAPLRGIVASLRCAPLRRRCAHAVPLPVRAALGGAVRYAPRSFGPAPCGALLETPACSDLLLVVVAYDVAIHILFDQPLMHCKSEFLVSMLDIRASNSFGFLRFCHLPLESYTLYCSSLLGVANQVLALQYIVAHCWTLLSTIVLAMAPLQSRVREGGVKFLGAKHVISSSTC